MTLNNYQWEISEEKPELIKQLVQELNLSPLLTKILVNRGITNPREVSTFLNPLLKDLHDPFLMKDMRKSAQRIVLALKRQEKIIVYGDYDVDGVTATALLICFFKEIGVAVDYYIPNRISEGYGLNSNALKKIGGNKTRQNGNGLIITVDCGITNYAEVKEAVSQGFEIIITDHHQIPPALPPAFAILNPWQKDCPYPYKHLCGVGIVYKLIIALRSLLREEEKFKNRLPNLKKHLDLVALGTLADIVPLTGENHLFARIGLKEIENSAKLGLKVLKEISGLKDKTIGVYQVSFILAPRINAPGRIDSARLSVELLISETETEAQEIAAKIEKLNQQRQSLQEKTFKEIRSMIKGKDLSEETIILSSSCWHLGVLGIVASKVVEEYCRPCILIQVEEEKGKGSARSITSFHLYEGLKKCADLLEKFGGHKFAAGITIKKENIEEFKNSFNRIAGASLSKKNLRPCLKIESRIELDQITKELVEEINKLAPFGRENPRPLFLLKGIRIAGNYRLIGKHSRHLKFNLLHRNRLIEVIGFNFGFNEVNNTLWPQPAEPIDIVFTPEINEWNGNRKIQLKLKDLRKCM